MKIALVSLTNIYLTPYIDLYLGAINCPFDVIVWDRHGKEEIIEKAQNVWRFKDKSFREGSCKIKKAIGYWRFIRYVRKTIKTQHYDKIIFLHTLSSILLKGLILRRYKKKYIVDVRDYTFENNRIFKNIESKVFNGAYSVFVSSNGYKSFLPNGDYTLTHNYKCISKDVRDTFYERRKKGFSYPIQISFIGLIRFMEQNKKIINFFKNDERFHINFIGKGANDLKKYIESFNVRNVSLIDYFDPAETIHYYGKTDVIMNLYGRNTPSLDYAISNKLYYSANLYLPILVCPNTFMEKMVNEHHLGFVVDLNDEKSKDKLVCYLKSIDHITFKTCCDDFIRMVETELDSAKKIVKEFTNEDIV